jgi:hypothetical protein
MWPIPLIGGPPSAVAGRSISPVRAPLSPSRRAGVESAPVSIKTSADRDVFPNVGDGPPQRCSSAHVR